MSDEWANRGIESTEGVGKQGITEAGGMLCCMARRKQASASTHTHTSPVSCYAYMGFVTPHSVKPARMPTMVLPRFPHMQRLDWLRRRSNWYEDANATSRRAELVCGAVKSRRPA